MPEDVEITGLPKKQEGELIQYECERCHFRYEKRDDFPPYLCYRCLRFIGKRTWTIAMTIQPVVSRPDIPGV